MMMLCGAVLLQAAGTVFIGYFDHAPKIVEYLLGLLYYTNGFIAFPTTLWLIYPVLGICFAGILRRVTDKQRFYKHVLVISTVCLIGVSIGTAAIGYNIIDYFVAYYQQSLFSTLSISCILGVSISTYYFISTFIKGSMQNIVKSISSNLNTVYIVEWLLITYTIAVKEIIGLGSLNIYLIIPVGIVVALCSIGIAWLWNRVKGKRRV
ncbi:hypothetical protein [Paenibacillus sp. DYY-L-2]|uniref:hypothetical protein n=1 Tax=Paenibacillus sp. DYY-L-2 TaxID=3447013 RepID=UPI003F5041F1